MIRLSSPNIGEDEIKEVAKVFDSKNLVQGDKVYELEKLVKEYLNVEQAIAVSSGTAALHLALIVLGVKPGDEIIVPNFTFPATANVVEIVGAKTILVDVGIDSLCIDTKIIEDKITNKTKAIIPVHEFGQCANMDEIMELAKKYNIHVIEDAACALGAEYRGKKAGTIGDIGCFSLHPRKSITTGEGGIIVTNNSEIANKLKIIRNHGLDYIEGKPNFVLAGYNYRMTNIQGAIGCVQMKKLDKINDINKKIATLYNEKISNIDGVAIPSNKEYGQRIWQTYHLLLDKKYNRDKIIGKLKEKNIEANFGAYSVHNQPYYKDKYKYKDEYFKNSIYAYNYGLALPLHGDLKDSDIDYILKELERILDEG